MPPYPGYLFWRHCFLPAFQFYAVRSLAETARPGRMMRRRLKNPDIIGPTTYTVDDKGVRSVWTGGADVCLPWMAFDKVRCDREIAVLMRDAQPGFFVPLAPFGHERDAVLAHIKARILRSVR